ncbi:MAG: hypothetical protein K0Q57_1041 [Gammaproteobacteria bacterium]|nr:hypothetical protein [Gammaproteobacteria bacterium]
MYKKQENEMDFITAANLILANKFGLAELGQCKFDINAPQKKYKCVESEYGFFDEDSDGEAGEGAGDKANRKLIYQYRHLTLLSVAVLANNLAAIKLLLKHGANPGLN